ncbi:hypothetical protein MP32_23060 [Escherichia coli N36410PS]|nr:hypothetical protein MP32_23060 [Escherichia coli N36410PS]
MFVQKIDKMNGFIEIDARSGGKRGKGRTTIVPSGMSN